MGSACSRGRHIPAALRPVVLLVRSSARRYGLDRAQSPWIDVHALKVGNKAVICSTLGFDMPGDPACIPVARALFGNPGQVKHMVYAVCDPKSQRLGRHVLWFWPENLKT